MAEKPIEPDEIIDPEVFDPAAESADKLLIKANALIAAFKTLATITGKRIPLADPKTLSEAEQLASALKKITDLENGLTAAQKLQLKAQGILNKQKADYRNQLKAEASAYKELENRYAAASQKAKNLAAALGIHNKASKEAAKEAKALNDRLKAIDLSMGDGRRQVGLYKEAIMDAAKESGLFGGKLGGLINTLKNVRDAQDKTATGAKALGNAFKLTGIGLVLAALAGLKAAFDTASEFTAAVSEQVEIFNAGLKGFTLGLNEGRVAFISYTKELISYRKEIILLSEALQKTSLDQADFLDISNDTTIGFKERNAALQESIRLGNLKAEQETNIARRNLQIVDSEIAAIQKANGGREVTIEFLQKRAEALHALNEAEDRQNDLIRENAQLERKIAEERTTAAIDLLLKTKQSANARKVTLEKELADERLQLEQRKKSALELAQVNTQTTNEELRIFKEGFKVKFDSNALVNEQDAVKLKQMIEGIQFLDENNKMVGLGVEDQRTLAQIVAKYQKETLEFGDLKKKLDEDEIKRTQRIAQINAEISIAQQADDVRSLQEAYDKLDEARQKNFDKLIDSPFSRKLQKQRQLQIEIAKQQAEDLFAEEVKLLELKAEADRQNIENTITDEKIKAAEIKKINEQLQIDLANLQGKALAQKTAINDKEIEEDKKLYRKKLSVVLDATQKITDGIADGLQKRGELQQQADQKEIDMKARMLDIQARLAAEGKDNVLGETLAQIAAAEEKKLQDAKKAAKQQETLALIQTFQEVLQDALKADKPFLQAFGEALAASGAVSSAFSKLFAGFYEGTEDTGTTSNPLDDKGGRPAIIHDNERIVPKRLNKKLKGISNDELVDRALSTPDVKPMFYPKISEPSMSVQEFNTRQIETMTKEIKGLRDDMASRPIQSNRLDKLGEWTEQIQTKAGKIIIHHKKAQSRPSIRLHG